MRSIDTRVATFHVESWPSHTFLRENNNIAYGFKVKNGFCLQRASLLLTGLAKNLKLTKVHFLRSHLICGNPRLMQFT